MCEFFPGKRIYTDVFKSLSRYVLLSCVLFFFFSISQLHITSFPGCCLSVRGTQLAARRSCRQHLPGPGLPAACSSSEAAFHGVCPGRVSEEGLSGGQGSGGLGGQLSGCLLGNWRYVFHSDLPLSQRTAVCQD